MWQHMSSVPVMRTVWRRELQLTSPHSTHTALQSALNRCTVQPFTEGDDTRCCVNAIFPPEDRQVNARNMSRIIV
jgi:hypothetical protein